MRAEKQQFLRELSDGLDEDPVFNKVIYANSRLLRERGRQLNTVTVIFHLDWPLDNAVPSSEADLPRTAVGSAIFRVKDFLERHLLAPLTLLDIHAGCIRARYLLPEGVKPWSVHAAVASLKEVSSSYMILDAKAHVAGRAIKP